MKKIYTDIEQLPTSLNAKEVAAFLGISEISARNLMHSKGFPTIRIGKRMIVSKNKFLEWIDLNSNNVQTI